MSALVERISIEQTLTDTTLCKLGYMVSAIVTNRNCRPMFRAASDLPLIKDNAPRKWFFSFRSHLEKTMITDVVWINEARK